MARLAFLFGAGASHGAGTILPAPPPLGAGLYDQLRNVFPETWGRLAPDLAALFEKDFESGMDALWRSAGQEQSQPLLEIGRFFATFRPDPSAASCYLRLIQLLESCNLIDACGFATLNYDCLFDLDLDSANFGYHDGVRRGPFPHRRAVRLWKLHGASNVLQSAIRGTGNRFYGVGTIYRGPVEYVTPTTAIENCDSDGFPPMLSLYAPGKPTPVADNVVEELRRNWTEWVKQSDLIVVIGARILQRDPHIYKPLKKARGQVWYVGDINDFRIRRPREAVGKRFDQALEGGLRKRILALSRRG
jgi:hypothetical protein